LVGILVCSADDRRIPAHRDRISELVAARTVGGGQLLLLLLAGPGGPQMSHFPDAGGSGAHEYVGGALRGIVADDDRVPTHGDPGSELVAARAIGGG
jgi:hypothetical protein